MEGSLKQKHINNKGMQRLDRTCLDLFRRLCLDLFRRLWSYMELRWWQINSLLYTCTYISLIAMTKKSVMTFFLSIKYLSVCLSGDRKSVSLIRAWFIKLLLRNSSCACMNVVHTCMCATLLPTPPCVCKVVVTRDSLVLIKHRPWIQL